MPSSVQDRKKKASRKPARAKAEYDAEVASWTDSKKRRVLKKLIREALGDGAQSIYIKGAGIIVPIPSVIRLFEFDDTTPHLRELRYRSEHPEGSVSLDEIIAGRAANRG